MTEAGEAGEYKAYLLRKVIFILVMIAGVFALFIYSLTMGQLDLGFFETYHYVVDHIMGATYEPGTRDWFCDYLIFNRNMPESVFAVIAGASLAVAGVAMQSVMNNPLADAYTTGISSGACLGVAIAMVLGINLISGDIGSHIGILGNAFVFSLIPMAIILLVAKRLDQSPTSLILAGTAISFFLNAFTMAVMLLATDQSLAAVYGWQVGSIGGTTWDDIPFMAATSIFGIVVISLLAKKLNVMSSGENSAKALGLDIEALRTACLLIMSLMVASVITYAGIIGFVGLVCPHIVRTIIDADNRYVIPASAVLGALMLIGSMIIAQLVATPALRVPVGVVLSFVGAPLFLLLIIRRKSHVW